MPTMKRKFCHFSDAMALNEANGPAETPQFETAGLFSILQMQCLERLGFDEVDKKLA